MNTSERDLAHVAPARDASRASIVWAILLIVFALMAMVAPLLASWRAVAAIAWLLVLSGIAHLMYARDSEGIGSSIWKILVAALYVAVGITMLQSPFVRATTLTFVVSVFLMAQGLIDVCAYNVANRRERSTWILVNGISGFALGWLIWNQWPSGSVWAVGTLVGINMLVAGAARLMLALPLLDLTHMSGGALND
jgi:uncharacterized membrane protein HdeD (DUF308 family)